MRALMLGVLLASLVLPQDILRVIRRGGGGGGGTVAVVGSSYATCANGSTSCTFTSKSMSSGNAYVVYVAYCSTGACSTTDFATVSASDGTNTYTEAAGAAVGNGSAIHLHAFIAKNVTGGTYSIVVSKTGTEAFYYSRAWFIELSGASTTAPEDTNISSSTYGTSASPSLTSPGNVTSANEVMLGMIRGNSGLSLTGAFSILDNIDLFLKGVQLVHPSSGSTVTLSGTQPSDDYQFSMIGIKP